MKGFRKQGGLKFLYATSILLLFFSNVCLAESMRSVPRGDGKYDEAQDFEYGYRATTRLYQEVLLPKNGDSETNYYLGIGKSPALLIASLQNLAPDYASTLPLSTAPLPMNAEEKTKLFDYFDQWVPSKEVLRGKKLHFTDMVWTGDSMLGQMPFFQEYMRTRRRGIEYDFTLMGTYWDESRLSAKLAALKKHPKVHFINVGKDYSALWDVMYYQGHLENVAEFGSARPLKSDHTDPARRPAYDRFRDALRERMQNDKAFMKALKVDSPKEAKFLAKLPAPAKLPARNCNEAYIMIGDSVLR